MHAQDDDEVEVAEVNEDDEFSDANSDEHFHEDADMDGSEIDDFNVV